MKTIGTIIIAFFLCCNLAVARDTLYVFKAGAVLYKQPVSNIDSVTFKKNTLATATVTDIDGNVYHTVTIGTQTWMVENLKTTKYNNGQPIPLVTDNTAWFFLSTHGYCWYNNDAPTYKNKYGALYNWYTVNTGKLAPTGWHVPTDAEWTTMENYLIANGYNYDLSTQNDYLAKSLAATIYWDINTDVEGAIGNDLSTNNSTGFSALPAGSRGGYGGAFDSAGSLAAWWSSSEGDADTACEWSLYYSSSSLSRYFDNKYDGCSVRCVRDN
jgi:uncharacterized protein (TIGR02145 family)